MQAKNILIAVGGRAVRIPIEGVEHAIISDDILELVSSKRCGLPDRTEDWAGLSTMASVVLISARPD